MIKDMSVYNCCRLCPRECAVDRSKSKGYCGMGDSVMAARAFLHVWEEPCISGSRGSGTVFFSGCTMKCAYCQNYEISERGFGAEISWQRLGDIFLELKDKGAHNINLVTASHFLPDVIKALEKAKSEGLNIPIVYNSSGYEKVECLKMLEGLVDIYLPDIKYFSDKYAIKYSKAPGYFKIASEAVKEMYRQVKEPVFNEEGIMIKGLMIRHLMLPGLLFDSKKIVDWVTENLPEEIYFNIMSQYTPMNHAEEAGLNRRLLRGHYESLVDYAVDKGIKNGFIQDFESSTEEYVPVFDLEGITK